MKASSSHAIVLRRTKYSEADYIVAVLLQSGSQLSLMARGAAKSKKRFGGGVLEPTHLLEIDYQESDSDRLSILNEARVVENFEGLRTDYDRLQAGLELIDTILKVSQVGDMNSSNLFVLTKSALSSLEKVKNLELFKIHFVLKFLRSQGVLEIEPWMHIYLKKSVLEMDQDFSFEVIPKHEFFKHLDWSNNTLNQYLKMADPR